MEWDTLQSSVLLGRIAIGTVALSHSLFATFIVGGSVIAAVVATLAYWSNAERHKRLALLIAFTLVLTTATISFLGVTLIFALNIFWPRFWHTIFRIMFWPFILEAGLFFGEAVFAYSWYYLWAWSSATDWRRPVHLGFVWLAATCAVTAMFLIDITASYMLTPHPLERAWPNILNPTMIHLDLHRWFGNLTWAGFALAALSAVAWARAKTSDVAADYRWAAGFCFAIGFGALLVMPVIGYHYLLSLRYAEPQAFHVLMLGVRSWLFDLVALLYGILVVVGSLYIRSVVGRLEGAEVMKRFVGISIVLLVGAAIVAGMPYHLGNIPILGSQWTGSINPLGKMQPYKYFAFSTLIVFGLVNWAMYLRSFRRGVARASGERRGAQPYLLVSLALTSVLIMLSMGWVRETARASDGYLIYGYMSFSDERPTYK